MCHLFSISAAAELSGTTSLTWCLPTPLCLAEGVFACPALELLWSSQLVSSPPQGVPKGVSGVLTDNLWRGQGWTPVVTHGDQAPSDTGEDKWRQMMVVVLQQSPALLI